MSTLVWILLVAVQLALWVVVGVIAYRKLGQDDDFWFVAVLGGFFWPITFLMFAAEKFNSYLARKDQEAEDERKRKEQEDDLLRKEGIEVPKV